MYKLGKFQTTTLFAISLIMGTSCRDQNVFHHYLYNLYTDLGR